VSSQHSINSVLVRYLPEGCVRRKYDAYKYESYTTGLGFLFLLIRPSPLLNEITIQTRVGGLFVQIWPLNFTVTAKKRTPDSRLGRTEAYWESRTGSAVSSQADVSVCDFIQLRGIYLSHNVNTDVEQRWGGINSPVPPTHTLHCVRRTPNFNDTEKIHMRSHTRSHTHTHTRCGNGLFIQLGQDQRTVSVPFPHLMCEKWKEIKAISFSLRAAVSRDGRGRHTGSKVSLRPQTLGSVWSAMRCQK